ncbi:ATPase [Mycolicibacterium fluoranthenivorans]|uniref:Adenylyl-sulfate kinase n=1 Tax=Mycolicibacterium fluoranthenivorans TaxID=258505 RepID=A0A7X5ZD44_9MYCO|nr:ATPase [Mycolicibacterium fluoranthenivorans]MCV7358151.1 ATPase [Mycolicibacterium fluoranthenivorans]NIH95729.1 hypothetical protein [Mycolicibacterium fluoranthenivorans]
MTASNSDPSNSIACENRSKFITRAGRLIAVGSEAIFLGGRSGVGKTTIALEMHAQLTALNLSHCVIDGDFLDMAHPPPWEHRLAERNLATMWENYLALGYRRLIYVSTMSVLPAVTDGLIAAMDNGTTVFGALLTCSEQTALRRLSRREVGSTLDVHVRSSASTAQLLAEAASGHIQAFDTDQYSVIELAMRILHAADWLPATVCAPPQARP